MNRRHIYAIARKEWLHIIRDPMTIFLLGIGPVLMLILVAYAMATDVKNVPVVVWDQDQTSQSRALVAELDRSSVLHVIGYVDSTAAYQRKLERREARLVFIIDQGFADQVQNPMRLVGLNADVTPRYSVVIDGTEPISAETALEAALNTASQFVAQQMNAALDAEAAAGTNKTLIETAHRQLEVPVQTQVVNRYNPQLKSIWDLAPALIAVVLTLPGISISTVIARERSEGTLESLMATPIDKHVILLGKSLPYMLVTLVDVFLMYAVTRVLFGVPFRGNLLLYLALSGLYVFATLAVGLLFSILIRSEDAALWASMMFFLFPGMFLSGMFFPVQIFPTLIKLETLELPVTSGVLINRGMFLQGAGVRVLWWNVVLLLIIALEGFEIAGRLFKKRIA
jgi:ABC-2 type transport system permease protein